MENRKEGMMMLSIIYFPLYIFSLSYKNQKMTILELLFIMKYNYLIRHVLSEHHIYFFTILYL